MNSQIPPGVTVFCDPTLAPAVRALGRVSRSLAKAPLSPLSAPAPLMLAQIARHTRNDVLFTLSSAMDRAVQLNFVKPETRVDGFSNSLVLAGLADRITPPANRSELTSMLATAKIAVTDDTVACGLDGRAVLAANGLPTPNPAQGAANTADVVFLLTSGAADIGLVYLTDVKADPRLTVIVTLTADPALTSYAAAVNAKAISPNAQALLNVMRSAQGRAVLQSAGIGTS